MKSRLVNTIFVVLVLMVGIFIGSANADSIDRIMGTRVDVNVTGYPDAPTEWFGSPDGGLVLVGTGPEFTVFKNGHEIFPSPWPSTVEQCYASALDEASDAEVPLP